jgi:hypothetical protein
MNVPALIRCAIAAACFLITAGLIAFALYKYHLTGDWTTELEWIYHPANPYTRIFQNPTVLQVLVWGLLGLAACLWFFAARPLLRRKDIKHSVGRRRR